MEPIMAVTNFGGLTAAQKKVWSRELWLAVRKNSFVLQKLAAANQNSPIQLIKELTRDERGDRCVIQLLADLQGDGVVGDNDREGREEAMQNYSQELVLDLISHGVKSKGKLSDQRTTINFREMGRDRLAYWLADRLDQLAMLTLSGISYTKMLTGEDRADSAFSDLAFAAQVTPPSSARGLMWDGSQLVPSNTAAMTPGCLPSYKAITEVVAYAKDNNLPPLRMGGKEYYVQLVSPGYLAKLKQDQDFQRAVTNAYERSKENPWFTGAVVTVDGLVFHETSRCFTNRNAANGQRWGASGNIVGTRSVLMGAQALGMADLGAPEWAEKDFEYGSRQGINIDKFISFLKPRFYSSVNKSVQDFGVITLDSYQSGT
jgi:N4-gp56 family major capsid protein